MLLIAERAICWGEGRLALGRNIDIVTSAGWDEPSSLRKCAKPYEKYSTT